MNMSPKTIYLITRSVYEILSIHKSPYNSLWKIVDITGTDSSHLHICLPSNDLARLETLDFTCLVKSRQQI